jgi:hypothetical protein
MTFCGLLRIPLSITRLRRNSFGNVAAIGLAVILVMGAVLRLSFPNDIEYKSDESGYSEESNRLLHSGEWMWTGPATSINSPSPGLGIEIITFLRFVFGANSPPELARAVQLTNVVALLGFVAFAYFVAPPNRKEYWLWAAALWAVNPTAVIFERKIWPVSTLPTFTVALLATWWYRRFFIAAFAWGLCGALIAQVHIGAACFIIALAAWTIAADWRGVSWSGWLTGSALGSILAIPWLISFLRFAGSGEGALRLRWPIPTFFLRWPTQPFGFGIEYTLGSKHMFDFLRGPVLFGCPTHFMAILCATLAAALITAVARALWHIRSNTAAHPRALLLGHNADALLVRATVVGYGGLLTLLTVFGADAHRHYTIVVAPIMTLWATQLAFFASGPRQGFARSLLAAVCLMQAALSFGLLDYIHTQQVIHGEYGPTLRYQMENCRPPDVGHPACYLPILKQ